MRLLLFTNLWISLAAGLVTADSYVRLGHAPRAFPVPLLVFFATLVVYNLDRLVHGADEDAVDRSDRHRWVARHRRGLFVLTAAAALGVASCLAAVSWTLALVLVPLGAVSLAYVLPVVMRRGRAGPMRLKEVPGLKIFVIAATWAAATVVLPAFEVHAPVGSAAGVAAERFLFVFAICLPFDVRDLDRDRAMGIRTLPAILGLPATRILGVVTLAGAAALAAGHYGLAASSPTWPLVATDALALGLVAAMTPSRGDLYYSLLLDGTLVVQALAVLAVVR